MHATGWHNGGPPQEPGGYGLKVTAGVRNKYFDRAWEEVVVVIDDERETTIPLSASFWRSCTELRSAELGRWFLDVGAAPWPKGAPPSIAVTPERENRFQIRLLRRRQLGA